MTTKTPRVNPVKVSESRIWTPTRPHGNRLANRNWNQEVLRETVRGREAGAPVPRFSATKTLTLSPKFQLNPGLFQDKMRQNVIKSTYIPFLTVSLAVAGVLQGELLEARGPQASPRGGLGASPPRHATPRHARN